MYVCKGCGREQNYEQFYSHPQMASGHLSFCKDCIVAKAKAHRAANLDRIRAYDRWRGELPHRKAKVAAYQATHVWPNKNEWRAQNPEKYRAHTLAQDIPLPDACQQCGAAGKLHRHHPDYSKPLLVEFLCPACHGRVHKEARNLARTASLRAES